MPCITRKTWFTSHSSDLWDVAFSSGMHWIKPDKEHAHLHLETVLMTFSPTSQMRLKSLCLFRAGCAGPLAYPGFQNAIFYTDCIKCFFFLFLFQHGASNLFLFLLLFLVIKAGMCLGTQAHWFPRRTFFSLWPWHHKQEGHVFCKKFRDLWGSGSKIYSLL